MHYSKAIQKSISLSSANQFEIYSGANFRKTIPFNCSIKVWNGPSVSIKQWFYTVPIIMLLCKDWETLHICLIANTASLFLVRLTTFLCNEATLDTTYDLVSRFPTFEKKLSFINYFTYRFLQTGSKLWRRNIFFHFACPWTGH